MQRPIRWILGIGLSISLASVPARYARATVMVSDANVVGGEFLFEMNYATLFSQFPAALVSASNISVLNFCCSAVRYALAQQGQASAAFVLGFDFSASSFQPNAVEIMDRVTLFTNTAVERVEAQVQYGQDGTGFFTQRIVQTPNDGVSVVIDSWDTYQLALSTTQPTFFYRLTMAPMSIDPDGVFTHPQNQWARTNGPGSGTTSFSVRFFSVPEPSRVLLLLPWLALRVRRRPRMPGRAGSALAPWSQPL